MKKNLKFIIPCLALILIILLFVKFVNLDNTQKITINHKYGGKNIHLEITDKGDFNNLIKLCEGIATTELGGVPSCGFGSVELVFDDGSKKTILYPACDTCCTMRLGEEDKFFYSISKKERAELEKILEKYGITFPCI